jgi:hypothetical protein
MLKRVIQSILEFNKNIINRINNHFDLQINSFYFKHLNIYIIIYLFFYGTFYHI